MEDTKAEKSQGLSRLIEAKPVRVMDLEEIKKHIPHRAPFLFLDRVDIIEEGKFAVGTKYISGDEPFFAGHFPGKPIMPAVLLLEAIAQVCAAMSMSLPQFKNKMAFFMSIREAKFRQPVLPWQTLKLAVEIERLSRAGKGRGEVYVDGKLCAEAGQSFIFSDSIFAQEPPSGSGPKEN